MVLAQYLDRTQLLTTPSEAPAVLPPVAKPVGYEVLHVVATGDATGFEFGLNASQMGTEPLSDPAVDAIRSEQNAALSATPPSQTQSESDSLFRCGPSDGVEIWEWFDAVQCWITEEIGQLDQIVRLSNQPNPPPDSNADVLYSTFDLLEDPLGEVATGLLPDSVTVELERGTLMRNESVEVTAHVFNADGRLVTGFLPDSLEWTSSAPVVSFNPPVLPIFTGEGRVQMNAGTTAGTAQVTVQMGALRSNPLSVRIVNEIRIRLSAVRNPDDRSSYRVDVFLVDDQNQPITNVNTSVKLRTAHPGEGRFVNDLVSIVDGRGSTTFFAKPSVPSLDLVASHPVYFGSTFTLVQPAESATRLRLDAPAKALLGERIAIPVYAEDDQGQLDRTFNDTVSAFIGSSTASYGSLPRSTIALLNGQGQLVVQAGRQTGPLQVGVDHVDLTGDLASIALTSRVDQADWSSRFPQDLVGSFVGFPAGQFWETNYFGGRHLMQGKTQAVIGSMQSSQNDPLVTLSPQGQISLLKPGYEFVVENQGASLALSLMDSSDFSALFQMEVPIVARGIHAYTADDSFEPGHLYLDPSNAEAMVERSGGFELVDGGAVVARFTKTSWEWLDSNVSLSLKSNESFAGLTLTLSRFGKPLADLYWLPQVTSILPEQIQWLRPLPTERLFCGQQHHPSYRTHCFDRRNDGTFGPCGLWVYG
ncbi:hypothetical protein IPJ72_07030 [Candidatus Peregrinibacteria bacterium]|nr:MAG: hypothetical protein IPJ72_07030 [Candidatus Peregrinibacteria bacterium]